MLHQCALHWRGTGSNCHFGLWATHDMNPKVLGDRQITFRTNIPPNKGSASIAIYEKFHATNCLWGTSLNLQFKATIHFLGRTYSTPCNATQCKKGTAKQGKAMQCNAKLSATRCLKACSEKKAETRAQPHVSTQLPNLGLKSARVQTWVCVLLLFKSAGSDPPRRPSHRMV